MLKRKCLRCRLAANAGSIGECSPVESCAAADRQTSDGSAQSKGESSGAAETRVASSGLKEQQSGKMQPQCETADIAHKAGNELAAEPCTLETRRGQESETESVSHQQQGVPMSQALSLPDSQLAIAKRAEPAKVAAPHLSFRRWDAMGNSNNAASEPYRLPKAGPLKAGGHALAGLQRWMAHASAEKPAKLESFDRKLGRPPNAVLEVRATNSRWFEIGCNAHVASLATCNPSLQRFWSTEQQIRAGEARHAERWIVDVPAAMVDVAARNCEVASCKHGHRTIWRH